MTDFSKMTEQERIKYLKEMPDEAIDYTDIPATDTTDISQFQMVKRAMIDGQLRVISSQPLYNPITSAKKKSVSIRLDEDIIAWLKTQSSQYQTHINAVLRAYYEANKNR